MKASELYFGKIVRYHPVMDGPSDGKKYEVRALAQSESGAVLVGLSGKIGLIPVEYLSWDLEE